MGPLRLEMQPVAFEQAKAAVEFDEGGAQHFLPTVDLPLPFAYVDFVLAYAPARPIRTAAYLVFRYTFPHPL